MGFRSAVQIIRNSATKLYIAVWWYLVGYTDYEGRSAPAFQQCLQVCFDVAPGVWGCEHGPGHTAPEDGFVVACKLAHFFECDVADWHGRKRFDRVEADFGEFGQ